MLPGEVGDPGHGGGDRTRIQSRCFEYPNYAVRMRRCRAANTARRAASPARSTAIGERWSLLIVRELSLGPLRFSDLARAVGGAPTDVLTKRLRDLESDGIVARRELDPPAAATVYELTELGRGLERPMLELAAGGWSCRSVEDVVGLAPSSLPNALRVILRPPADAELRPRPAQRRPELRAAHRATAGSTASRGDAGERRPDPRRHRRSRCIAAVVVGAAGVPGVEIEGDRELLERAARDGRRARAPARGSADAGRVGRC